MGWDGSGNFTRTDGNRVGSTTWAQARDAGALINAPDADHHDQDVADGLENCITKDGQNSPSANLPMNAKKHTGVADAAAATEYAAYGQLLALVSPFVGATGVGGTANAITLTPTPAITSYDDRQGLFVVHRNRQHRTRDGSRVGAGCGGASALRWHEFHGQRSTRGPPCCRRLQRPTLAHQHCAAD